MRPLDRIGIVREVTVLPPAVLEPVGKVILCILRDGAILLIGILVRQFGEAVAARLVVHEPREALIRASYREVCYRRADTVIACIVMVHVAGSGIFRGIHRDDDEGVVHPVVRDGIQGVREALRVISTDQGSVAEPAAQCMARILIPFRIGDNGHRIDVEQVAVSGVRLLGEESLHHLVHRGCIGAVLDLPVGESVAHQDNVYAPALLRLLQLDDFPVPAEIRRDVIVGSGKVVIMPAPDILGITGPVFGRLVPVLKPFRNTDHQAVVPEIGVTIILVIARRGE